MSTNFLIDTNNFYNESIVESDSDIDSDVSDGIDGIDGIDGSDGSDGGWSDGNVIKENKNTRSKLFKPEIIKKRILVDTYQLNKNSDFNSSDYEFSLYSSNQQETANFNRTGGLGLFKNVIGFRLLDCIIENTTYTINDSNNQFSYYLTGQLDDILISKLNNKINRDRISRTILEEPEIKNNLTEYIVVLNNGIYELDNINDCIPRDTAGIVIGNKTGRILPYTTHITIDETIPSPSIEEIDEFLENKSKYYTLPKRVEYNNMVDINIYYDDNEKRIIVRSPLSIIPYWDKNQQTRGFAQSMGFYNNIDQLRRTGFNGRDNNRILGDDLIPIVTQNPVNETINQFNNNIKLHENILKNIDDIITNSELDIITICNILPCALPIIDHINSNSNDIPFLSDLQGSVPGIDNRSGIDTYINNFNLAIKDFSLPDNKNTIDASTFKSDLEISLVCIKRVGDEGDEGDEEIFRKQYSCSDYTYKELYSSDKIVFNRRYFDIPLIEYQKKKDLINLIPDCYYMESPASNIQGPEPILTVNSFDRNHRIFKLYDYKENVCKSSDQDSNYKTTYILTWTNPPQTEITPLISKNQYRFGIIADLIPHFNNSYIDLVIDEIPDIATIGNSIGLKTIERISTKNTKFNEGIRYDTIKSIEYKQNYFFPIILDKLSIKLYGDNGYLLDNNSSDNSFEFEITMINANNDM